MTHPTGMQWPTPITDEHIRALAQTDPVTNLTTTAGELAVELITMLDTLTRALRSLDRARDALQERGIAFDVDLGPIGNAAAAARRDLEKPNTDTFHLPR
jgi:hypothetical protein